MDQQDKTEQATPHKLEEARKKGMVPQSADLMSFGSMAVFLVVLSAVAVHAGAVIARHTHWWLRHAGEVAGDNARILGLFGRSATEILYAVLPLIAALLICAVVLQLAFHGFVLSLEPIKPDFKRLNPVNGLKKIFSRKTLVELAKVLLKGLCFGLIIFYLARSSLVSLLALQGLAPATLVREWLGLLLGLGFALLAVFAAAAAWDMWHSRSEFLRQMRMSRHEVKDEYRKREGDPEIKSKRKSVQQELVKKLGALGKVKDADVIITNPTHYAVALQYRPDSMLMPVVVALGKGLLARQICSLARRHGVPIVRRPPLARLLHRRCGVKHPIPLESQSDVAAVYRWIISLPGNKVVLT